MLDFSLENAIIICDYYLVYTIRSQVRKH